MPLRHGHAISIDMAFSATLANRRGLLSDEEHRRLLNLFSRCGLSMDHAQFDEEILDKATQAILKTRDGKLRAAVPHPLGSCTFLNDVGQEEMVAALRKHKELMKQYPRNGAGLEAFVDASDTGYTINAGPVVKQTNGTNGMNRTNGEVEKTFVNDEIVNEYSNGDLHAKKGTEWADELKHADKHAACVDVDDTVMNGIKNDANGHTNSTANRYNAHATAEVGWKETGDVQGY